MRADAVTHVAQRVVPPSVPMPRGALPLSWLDRCPMQRALIKLLHIFKGCISANMEEAPVDAIECALAAALVSYNPIASRLTVDGAGDLVVYCSSEGVWFVEATASCTLEEVDYLEYPLVMPKDELLPRPTFPASNPCPEDSLILLIQVTQFACGDFVVGFRFNHAGCGGYCLDDNRLGSVVGQISS